MKSLLVLTRIFIAMLFVAGTIPSAWAAPIANAGPDITIADYDGNASVTQRLNGSGSQAPVGVIVSWNWTWSGGSASGQITEGTFPVTNSATTVTLTVTDSLGGTASDTLQLAAYAKEAALFKDFTKPTYRDVGGGLEGRVAGNTLVIDYGGVDVFRRSGNVWTQTPFPTSSANHLTVDQDTVVSGFFAVPTDLTVTRYNGSQWLASPLTLSVPPPGGYNFVNTRLFAVDPQTVVISDFFDDTHGTDAGKLFVYNWSGNDWNFLTELSPPAHLAGERFGQTIAVQDDLIVASSLNAARDGNEFHVFRKTAGIWSHEITFNGQSPTRPNGKFNWGFGLGGGVIASEVYDENGGFYRMLIYQKTGGTWVETVIDQNPPFYSEFVVDNDGTAIAASGFSGSQFVYKKNAGSSGWSTATITQQQIKTDDLNSGARVSDFTDGILTLRDGTQGLVRVIDTRTNIHPINAEPVASAGDDIATTSYDGQPVRVFLNGGGTTDIDELLGHDYVWTWPGGTASGVQTFAWLDPQVSSVELTVTDGNGAISRDSIAVDIVAPPVVEAGDDVVVVDSDGDGSIRMKVSGSVVSQDYPISSWNWRWPGGTFNGQSGTITIGQPADGESVVLEVLDENGLSRETSFGFRLLDPNPAPFILKPADGKSGDLYGWSVAIDQGTAMVGALNKVTSGFPLGATYLAENINNIWQQYQLAPGTGNAQGSDVLIEGDEAFVGTHSNTSGGSVRVYRRQSGNWVDTQTLTPGSGGFNFGLTIAKSGNFLLVGAPGSTITQSSEGAAYLYEKVGNIWTFRQRLQSPVPESYGRFGTAVAIHGDALVVGSSKFNENYNLGIAHVFEKSPTVWNLVATLQSDLSLNSLPGYDVYGRSVAINSTEILIGAPEDPANPTGSIYRYTRTAGVWTPNGRIVPVLPPSPPPNVTKFGAGLNLKGDILVVGVPGNSTSGNKGSVSTYLFKNGAWESKGSLVMTLAIDPFFHPNAGDFAATSSSIDHDGKDLIIGATNARSSTGLQTGKAYIYRNYAALNPNANYEPLANAGVNITADDTLVRGPAPDYLITEPLGSEMVTLNGSSSTDQENAIVSYEWSWPGGSASGVTAAARFPVGTTTVTLTVTDNKNIVNTDTVNITVSLAQTIPAALPVTTGNTLTLNLPSPDAKWRLSSEFLWHGDGESASNVVDGATYQIEIIAFPGSTEVLTTFVTVEGTSTTEDLELDLAEPATTTGSISFPETGQGFSWRLTGESLWRNVTDNGDQNEDDLEAVLPTGEYRIEFKPVTGFATPLSRIVSINDGSIVGLDWSDYLRISNFDPAHTFDLPASPDLAADPYQYIGMIRSPLGRGTGTVVAERVVLTAAHLFFDANGLQWSDAQWFSRQQQGARQAPPIAPRGVLYRTSYAKLVAPDSVEGTIPDLPDDDQEVDFAVLYFSTETNWDQGSANFLQSTAAKNWLTGTENKQAAGYPQRSQPYEHRGKIFTKQFTAPLSPLDGNSPPKLYETSAVFGDGGASGSALFVQPQGGTRSYPAAILLAGQGRGVYHVIDADITRMIKDGEDAASGNDEVLDSNSSLLDFEGLGSFTTVAVHVNPAAARTNARWSIKPKTGAGISNMKITREVLYDSDWDNITITFTAVSGYATPAPLKIFKNSLTPDATNTYNFTYTVLPPPAEPPTPLQAWKDLHGINNLSADGDKDGMDNLLEYALNRDPGTADYRRGIRNTANPSQSTYAEYDVYVSTNAEGITYKVKASNNLNRTNTTTLATFTNADGPSGYRKVTDTQPISTSTKRFAWLEVVAPSP
ncbi:MAG: hypothetical protein V4689_02725 [Verrucomicrobiota bacterium]